MLSSVGARWAVGLSLLGCCYLSARFSLNAAPLQKPVSPKSTAIVSGLILQDVAWSKTRAGVLYAHFSVKNDSPSDVRDFTITCWAYGESGTALGYTAKIIYSVVQAHSVRDFEGVEIGLVNQQTASIQCQATR